MAVTSIWAVKGWLGKVVIYAQNPDKTENPAYFEKLGMTDEQAQGLSDVIDYAAKTSKTRLSDETAEIMRHFVTGVNCEAETARVEMLAVKQRYRKTEGVVAYHGYQSFSPGEVTPETAHEIGVKLAERLWGNRHQVLVTTHLDKVNHLHNHFVLNNVSMVDGKKYYRSEQDYADMVRVSDALCAEYGLSVVDTRNGGKSKHYAEWEAEKDGRATWRGTVKAVIDEAIAQSMTESQFVAHLQKRGLEVKLGKDVSIRPPGRERFFRLGRNFGEAYTRDGIIRQIRQQQRSALDRNVAHGAGRKVVAAKFKGNIKTAKKLIGFRALYVHYLYLMGKLPKKNPRPTSKVHFLFREDLVKIDRISDEIKLLCCYRIDTSEQLFSYKAGLTARMEALTADRADLRLRLRRCADEPTKAMLRAQIALLTTAIGEARKEVSLCDDIAERTERIKEKSRIVRHEQKIRGKERTRNEPFR